MVRALVDDDPDQSPRARDLLTHDFALSASVLVEIEWVLRSQYRWSRAAIAKALTELSDLPALVDAPPDLAWAIDRFAAGADFADMIHLVSAGAATRFVTFDRRLKKRAGPDTPLPIEML